MRRWSAAIRQIEVLAPRLTGSHWDEEYWDDVAESVAEKAGERPSHAAARSALAAALSATFPDVPLKADTGLYRDELDRRRDLIVDLVLKPSSP